MSTQEVKYTLKVSDVASGLAKNKYLEAGEFFINTGSFPYFSKLNEETIKLESGSVSELYFEIDPADDGMRDAFKKASFLGNRKILKNLLVTKHVAVEDNKYKVAGKFALFNVFLKAMQIDEGSRVIQLFVEPAKDRQTKSSGFYYSQYTKDSAEDPSWVLFNNDYAQNAGEFQRNPGNAAHKDFDKAGLKL